MKGYFSSATRVVANSKSSCRPTVTKLPSLLYQVYAWGDNDHGQQGNGTTNVNRKPGLVQGLEGFKITRVACGSSHSMCWCTSDLSAPTTHDPVLFSTARDALGAALIGMRISF